MFVSVPLLVFVSILLLVFVRLGGFRSVASTQLNNLNSTEALDSIADRMDILISSLLPTKARASTSTATAATKSRSSSLVSVKAAEEEAQTKEAARVKAAADAEVAAKEAAKLKAVADSEASLKTAAAAEAAKRVTSATIAQQAKVKEAAKTEAKVKARAIAEERLKAQGGEPSVTVEVESTGANPLSGKAPLTLDNYESMAADVIASMTGNKSAGPVKIAPGTKTAMGKVVVASKGAQIDPVTAAEARASVIEGMSVGFGGVPVTLGVHIDDDTPSKPLPMTPTLSADTFSFLAADLKNDICSKVTCETS